MLEDLCELAPRRSTRQQNSSEIDFWAETFQLLERTTIVASCLLHELEGKAGLDAESLEREREQQRGLRPSKEAEGTEDVDGAST